MITRLTMKGFKRMQLREEIDEALDDINMRVAERRDDEIVTEWQVISDGALAEDFAEETVDLAKRFECVVLVEFAEGGAR
jgi:hypothetical protein